MQSTAAQAASAAKPMSRFNRFFVRWLASPLGFLSGNAVLVRYAGRKTGASRELPVNARRYEDGYLIRVGKPETKTWWRNFTTPWPIELVRGRRHIRGEGLVVPGTSERGRHIAAEYFTTHHGAARRAGLPRLDKGEQPAPGALEAAAASLVFLVVTPKS